MAEHPNLCAISPPYQAFTPPPDFTPDLKLAKGLALVWKMPERWSNADLGAVISRPWSIPLLAVLPRSSLNARGVLELLEDIRPHSVLPNCRMLAPEDVVAVLRTEPEDLPGAMLDLLAHAGVLLDKDTRRLIGKMIEHSNRVRSLSDLCRQLYVSRRALGRRFFDRRLPPPSHWLQFSRALRVCLRLQSSGLPVASIATTFGYPDAFTLSNQLVRLIGARPSDVRECLGWEWLVWAWMEKERQAGHFCFVEASGLRRPRRYSPRPPSRPIRYGLEGAIS